MIKLSPNAMRDIERRRAAVLAAVRTHLQRGGMKVLAAGIETPLELEATVRAGVDYGQGGALARPGASRPRAPGHHEAPATLARPMTV